MQALGYRCTGDNGLSFVLLVDGQPLGETIGSSDRTIPYWIIEDDFPHLPASVGDGDPEVRIVAVCSCGDYGCGHTGCRVAAEGGAVTFYDFDHGASLEGRGLIFRFARSNYEAIMSEIVRLARRQAGDAEPRAAADPGDVAQ